MIETADDTTPQTFTSRNNQTLVIDISNAQLRLPQANQFRQNNPVAGIRTIKVIRLEPNNIRISIVGETTLPTQRLVSTTELGINSSLTRFADSVDYNLQHSISGTEGDFDYVVSAAFGGNGGFFDAQGGIADTETINILGKVGANFSEQRLQLSFNHFNERTRYQFTRSQYKF